MCWVTVGVPPYHPGCPDKFIIERNVNESRAINSLALVHTVNLYIKIIDEAMISRFTCSINKCQTHLKYDYKIMKKVASFLGTQSSIILVNFWGDLRFRHGMIK